ncbi:MAG: alpha-galactosidase, partial [Armatimonadetes bacterium]|nr:alpha-galactosidase [Armatimonadota bacterium]
VVERGRQAGVEVCLWFNPSKDNSYAHWEDDARTLVGLFREHGIRVFKIDGVDIPDKRADLNLRAMFERVLEETNHEVTFNLDATASRRFGYHYLNEYGTIFLANRYTDSASYYPHWTLRNLWQLARYVPAQNLQMEFLNRWRNPDQYPADDPLAPSKVPFDYCFAVTMAAQPLAWFEVQNLPAAGREIAPLVRAYRAVQPELHGGCILPVGDEPDGTSWPGFQSVESPQQGLLLVYRECNDQPAGYYRLFGTAAGERFSLTPVLGHGQAAEVEVDASGHLAVALPRPFSFALYRYARR